jgi:cytochrome d ubiquinol oxidase subunit I
MTPFLTAGAALSSLILFGAIYLFIFSFGTLYIYRLLRDGPSELPYDATPNRPMSLAGGEVGAAPSFMTAGE